ncbi:MAG: hypothetical protein ABFE07_28420 [Armatimonadia bacterium]
MQVRNVTVQAFTVEDVKGLDPLLVVLQDDGPGKGRLLVECFGEAWSNYWGAMGENTTVASFVLEAGIDYLESKMQSPFENRRKRSQYLRKILGAVQDALRQRLAAGGVPS